MVPDPDAERRLAAVALGLAPGVGPIAYRDLVARYGTADRAFATVFDRADRDALLGAARREIVTAQGIGARLLLIDDPEYPPRLLDLPDPPPLLFVLGDVSLLRRPAVAIVGTRRATPYGERIARDLARALGSAGVVVVSGMARGIDGVAHRAALSERGPTVAVLGTGVDVPYPFEHRRLYREIVGAGAVVAELPCGTHATRATFPRRNRIIAALAAATIIVEAPDKSGAIITSNIALELNRTLGAVPGPVDAPNSAGTNKLLRDGATVICGPADALALVGVSPRPPNRRPPDGELARRVWDLVGAGATDVDALIQQSGVSARDCLATLTALELAGFLRCDLTGEVHQV